MSVMQVVFLAIAVIGLFYFLFVQRQFDFFSVEFFSACVYFLPGFVGYTLMPTRTSMELPVDLEDETYLVMITVLIAIFLGALLIDFTPKREAPSLRFNGTERSAMWAVAIAFIGYLLLV